MSSLRHATASNVRAFQNLTTALSIGDCRWAHALDKEALEDEIGRFRVWAGNLGALQKGHSSLDYRLRDSPVSSTNILKLLRELETNVNEAYAVVSGARLPYEEQTPPDLTEDDDDDDGFFSADSDDENSSSDEPRTELSMRFREVVDIIDNLYKLSVRIRTPGLRSRSLKASSFTQKDPETGIDIFDVYAEQDLKHVKELVAFLRQPYAGDGMREEQDFLIKRLSAAVTLRRRHFKYWKRHRDKLSAAEVPDEVQEVNLTAPLDGPAPARDDSAEVNPKVPAITTLKEAPSQKTGKTLLSGTEATQLHQPLDDIIDNKSVTSYAVTVRDVHGKSIELPPPPKTANADKDFECPYCWVVCPARYSKGRSWRTHLLQDLQPYCCTYVDCESSHLLFRSRREWAEHEASHRKVWRCPEHPDAVFSTQSGLENHLRQGHLDSFPESQLETITKVGEATGVDMRAECPICCAPADTKDLGDLQSHIANHLERIATFALPHGSEDDSDGASGIASPGSTSSRSLLDSVSADEQAQEKGNQDPPLEHDQPEPVDTAGPGRHALSIENLQQLPDTSRNALDLISEQLNNPDSSYHQDLAQISSAPPPLEVNDIPTLSSLYRSRRLLQTDQSYSANDVYNRMISFCSHDLTKLKLDAIVNNAPLTLTHSPPPGTLHHALIKAGGAFLQQELMSRGRLRPGHVTWTRGYALPSSFVIHAAAPTFVGDDGFIKFNLLGDCYRNALDMAAEIRAKTIAFPCLGTGGGIFPPRQAARTALQAVRDYLDAHPESELERIVFCVMAAGDRQAYTDFFPVFFPPTHSDLDRARGSTLSSDHAVFIAKILEILVQVEKATTLLTSVVIQDDPETQKDVNTLRRIKATLELMHNQSHTSEMLKASQKDVNLLSFVLLDLCRQIIRMAQIAKEHTGRTYQDLRTNTDQDMRAKHGFDFRRYLTYCWTFAVGLNQGLTSGKTGVDITVTRTTLERYMIEAEKTITEDDRDNPFMPDQISVDVPADNRQVSSTPSFHDSTEMSAYNQDSREQHDSQPGIFIGNLDPTITQMSLFQLFKNKYPSTESAKIVSDTLSGESLGYGFVRFDSKEDQQKALFEMQGVYCGNRPMRIKLTKRKDNVDQWDDETLSQDSTSPVSHRQGIIKLDQIPSVARFYELGAIEAQSTLAPPSASFNDTVCLIKEDITRLDVDVIVNITDKSFLGMGTLDRTIFKKGGPELQSKLERIGECKIGDVVLTPGYLLPAKHILHIIPPGVFRSDTKTVLRNLYREILLKATYLDAKSVAIPCIGMGPPRDCASLAMEEVRRFLQSKEPGGLEKIVFTVYSSNNESIYRRLLPVYFPPPEGAPANRLEGPSLKRAETLPSKPTSGPEDSQSSRPEQIPQTVSDGEPLATVTARIFISEYGETTPRPVYEDLGIIRILRYSVIISRRSDNLESAPSTSFSITPDTKWELLTGFYDLAISEVQRDELPPGWTQSTAENGSTVYFNLGTTHRQRPPGDMVKVYVRCNEPSDVDVLFEALEQAIKQYDQDLKEKEGEEEQRGRNVLSSSAKGKGKATLSPVPEARTSNSIPATDSGESNSTSADVASSQGDAIEGELAKILDPKSLAALQAAGGLEGLEKGLRTDQKAGLSADEQYLDGAVTFEEATTPDPGIIRSQSDGEDNQEYSDSRRRPLSISNPPSAAIIAPRPIRPARTINLDIAPAVDEMWSEPDIDHEDDENRHTSKDVPESAAIAARRSNVPQAKYSDKTKQGEADRQEKDKGSVSSGGLIEQFRRLFTGSKKSKPSAAAPAASSARTQDIRSYSQDEQNRQNVRDEQRDPPFAPRSRISPEILLVPGKKEKEEEEEAASRQELIIDFPPSAKKRKDTSAFEAMANWLEAQPEKGSSYPNVTSDVEEVHVSQLPEGHPSLAAYRDFQRLESAELQSAPPQPPPNLNVGAGWRPRRYETLEIPEPALKAHKEQTEKERILDAKIINHLRNDLLSRPTSYIGQNINDMAAALDTDTATLSARLGSLEQKGQVHRTVNGETWVVDGWEGR